MKGLIIKDLINLKNQSKLMIILIAFYVFLAISSDNNSMLGGILMVMCAVLPVTALAFDEKAKWDKYALSMPVSRRDMVVSKYLLGGLLFLAAFIINVLFNLFTDGGTLKEIMLISLSFLGVGVLFMSAILPILFKYGVEKGRLIMILLLFLPTALIIFFAKLGLEMPDPAVLKALAIVAPFFVVAVLFASVIISLRVYGKKEL